MSKVDTVMHEWGQGKLHSGSKKGPVVENQKQAVAIALSEARKAGEKVPKRQMGGTAPWYVRQESRGLMHTGPINSAVPGRTDTHRMSVPSSSYVFPADFVSHLGQNNSAAGMSILGKMTSGPYGGGKPMGIPHGHLPAAPHLPKMGGMGMSDRGGSRGGDGNVGQPVDVVTAGGEWVASPEHIMNLMHNIGAKPKSWKEAHSLLDKWVLDIRKKHIAKLKSLPPPVKS